MFVIKDNLHYIMSRKYERLEGCSSFCLRKAVETSNIPPEDISKKSSRYKRGLYTGCIS